MSETRDGGRAFPMSTVDGYSQDGMTRRDWLSGHALAGLMANPSAFDGHAPDQQVKWAADVALLSADSLLAAITKTEG